MLCLSIRLFITCPRSSSSVRSESPAVFPYTSDCCIYLTVAMLGLDPTLPVPRWFPEFFNRTICG